MMKMFLKIIGVIVVCLALLLVVFRITGLDPNQRRPGLWLTGEVVTTPVTDWSFTDQVPNMKIQTNTWYGIPHSVTINCVSYKGQLYLDSFYAAGLTFPHGRTGMRMCRDPHVRLKIGDKLYDRTLVLVTDPAEKAAVDAAKGEEIPHAEAAAGRHRRVVSRGG